MNKPRWLADHKAMIYEHYLSMCKNAGTKDHAWHMIKQLDQTEMHKGIKARISREMTAPHSLRDMEK